MSVSTIARALGSAYRSGGGWWRCRCPVHNSAGPTLALRDGSRGLVVFCHAGCRGGDILAELQRLGLFAKGGRPAVVDPVEIEWQREVEREQRTAAALDFWHHETAPAANTMVERYWRARGLGGLPIPATIRTSRSWPHHPEGGNRPIMVALVEHVEHCPVGIHRTWLQVDGAAKASFREPRRSLGPVGGGAVRLAEARADLPLIVAEGIKTAASVMLATSWPAWAALSAGGIERLILPPPPLTSTVFIAADNDPNGTGERAARNAAERWIAEGRKVRISLPSAPGTDWNDVLLSKDVREARHAA